MNMSSRRFQPAIQPDSFATRRRVKNRHFVRSLFFFGFFLSIPLVIRAGEITGTLQAPAQTTDSVAAAWIDLPAALKTASPDLTKISVKVSPVDGTSTDPDIFRAGLRQVDGGFYQILWEVPKASDTYPVGAVREFQFSISRTAPKNPEEPLEANLIENGDFSQPLPPQSSLARMQPSSTTSALAHMEIVSLPEGGNALAFGTNEEGHGPVYMTSVFAVTGGESYEVSFRYKIENANPHERYNLTFYSWLNFLDAEGKTLWVNEEEQLAERKSVVSVKDTDSGGWQQVNVVVPAPTNAARAYLDLRNGSTEPLSVMITDIRVVPTSLPNAGIKPAGSAAILPNSRAPDVFRRFDFGPEAGVTHNGFMSVSPKDKYEPKRGWGFSRLDKPEAVDGQRPDALGRDFILADDAEFQVDLPDGEYLIWFLIGDAQGSNGVIQRFFFNQFLSANAQIIHQFDPDPAEYIPKKHLAHYSDFWLPGMDYYNTFVRPKFEEKTAKVRVINGKLSLRWRNLPVVAAMIRSAGEESAFEADITRIARERRRDTHITEVANPVNKTPIQPTPEESGCGFVLFRKSTNEGIYPTDIPKAEERVAALEAFAAAGQNESVWFSLHALKDAEPVSLKVSNLQDGENTIDASKVDIRVARYIFQDVNGKGVNPDYRYRIAALPLDKREKLPLFRDHNWTWCLDIQIPENTPAGVYHGVINIVATDGRELASLPLALRVLPFHLEPLPNLQGYYYLPGEPWYAAFWNKNIYGKNIARDPALLEIIKQNERREFAFMKSQGLNSIAFGDDLRGDLAYRDGEVSLKTNDRLSFWMDLYKEAGFSTMPWYGFDPIGAATGSANRLSWLDDSLKPPHTKHWHQAYRSLVRNVASQAKERGWPEILFYISDELSNVGQQGAELGVTLGQSLKEVDGIRTIASMNGPAEKVVVPHVDIAMPNFAFPLDDGIFEFMDKSGTEMWLYNCGAQRLMLGFWVWRMDVNGRYQWHYRPWVATPWDDPGGGALSKYAISYPSPEGPMPTIASDIARAAINDHRYMTTLEKNIAKRRGDPAYAKPIQAAEQFIKYLRELLPADARLLMDETNDARDVGGVLNKKFANNDAITRIRWATAQLILDLQ